MEDADTKLVEQVFVLVDGPYLLPPFQLTEDSLEALMHVVKLNIGHAQQIQREKDEFRFKKTSKTDVEGLHVSFKESFDILGNMLIHFLEEGQVMRSILRSCLVLLRKGLA